MECFLFIFSILLMVGFRDFANIPAEDFQQQVELRIYEDEIDILTRFLVKDNCTNFLKKNYLSKRSIRLDIEVQLVKETTAVLLRALADCLQGPKPTLSTQSTTSTGTTQASPFTTENSSTPINVTLTLSPNATVPVPVFIWPADDPCSNYTVLNEPWRNVAEGKNYFRNFKCDGVANGFEKNWYRFKGPAGTTMASKCQPIQHCGTYIPLYLNGTAPYLVGDVANVTLCATSLNGCCDDAWAAIYTPPWVTVKNCGDYFVYELEPTTGCYAAYCGSN